jgi:hypothetical protein
MMVQQEPAEIRWGEEGGQAIRASLKERNIHVELIFEAELI